MAGARRGALVLVALALLLGAGVQAAQIDWHSSWQAALKAAKAKGHLAYIFVYLPGRSTCAQMDEFSFHDPKVVELMKDVEAGAVNAATTEGGKFIEAYRLPYVQDKQRGFKLAVVPAHLFFAPDGTELHRQTGFLPPLGFMALVERIKKLYKLRERVRQNKSDAKAQAELGHLYLLLDHEEQGRRHLELAIALDPENRAKACERARLDLAILSIESNPELGVERLRRWLDTYKRSDLRVEAKFYLATAFIAAGQKSEAEKVLQPFRNARKGTPEAESEWGARARALLKELPKL